MSAWSNNGSPYHAVGIYIGGANSGCAQPNLSAGWVSSEVAAGWHLIPTYVGLQAPTTTCPCATIDPAQASAQGAAAANDAAGQAGALGIPPDNPIYFDMEHYTPGGSATSTVLAFLAAWTTQLHADGYTSGVYSSGASGISDLAGAQGTGFTEPDDIWIAVYDGQQTVSEPAYVPDAVWANHQRLHQYAAGHDESYNGVTLSIDNDYLDGATADTTASPVPDGSFVQVAGSPAVYRVIGGSAVPVIDCGDVGGCPGVITVPNLNAYAPTPANNTFVQVNGPSGPVEFARAAGGALIGLTSCAPLNGCSGAVAIDQPGLAAYQQAHPLPSDYTLLYGAERGDTWAIVGGHRFPAAFNTNAVAVNDASIDFFPPPPPPPVCVVPALRRLTLRAAGRALTAAHCRLGKVHRHGRRHLRVLRQSARRGSRHAAGYRVAVTLTPEGRRQHRGKPRHKRHQLTGDTAQATGATTSRRGDGSGKRRQPHGVTQRG